MNQTKKYPRIKFRIFFGLAFLLALFVTRSIISYQNITNIQHTVEDIVKHPYTVSNAARDIRYYINSINRISQKIRLSENQEELQQLKNEITALEVKIEERFKTIESYFLGNKSQVIKAEQSYHQWNKQRKERIETTPLYKNDELERYLSALDSPMLDSVLTNTRVLITFADNKVKEISYHSQQQVQRIKRNNLFVLIGFIVLTIAVCVWIVFGIHIPLNKIIKRLRKVDSSKNQWTTFVFKDNILQNLDNAIELLELKQEAIQHAIDERTTQLTQSQNLIQTAISNSPIGIAIVHPKGKFLQANPTLCQMFGYEESELKEKTFVDITHPEDINKSKGFIDKSIGGQRIKSVFEKRYLHKNGNTVYALVSSVLVKDENDIPAYFFSHILDVTEQTLASQNLVAANKAYANILEDLTHEVNEHLKTASNLKESEKRFRVFMNSTNDFIFLKDNELKYLFVNKANADFFQTTAENMIGKTDKAFLPAEAAEKCAASDKEAIKQHKLVVHQEEVGEQIYETTKFPLDLGNEETGVGAIIRDITFKTKADKAIKESEERLSLLFKTIPTGIIIIDPETRRIEDINPNALKLMGAKRADIIGKKCNEFLCPAQEGACPICDLKQEVDLSEKIVKTIDSAEIPVLKSVTPIFINGQRKLLETFIDITEQKRVEKELLERKQKEKEIIETELAKTKEALMRTARLAAVGQVSASIAHDLRNPLGSVRNAAYYLKKKIQPDDEKLVSYFKIIDDEINTADLIIGNLLQLARTKEPEKMQIQLKELITMIYEKTKLSYNFEMELFLQPEDLRLYCDKNQILQVFGNLFENAAQSKEQGVKVFIEAHAKENQIFITFRDNGPGISAEVLDRLFEPLVTTKAKGTGLGLTISKQIIEKHGGSIRLVEHQDGGACFEIIMPV